VTFEEWDACVAAGGCGGHTPKDMDWGRGRHPVINVSWDDAHKYLAWLSAKTGKKYRLLSEAEWEYAARGKTAGTANEPPFWWGSSIDVSQANYDASKAYGGGTTGEYREKTIDVGSFQPNPFGLHDVHGNVSEWVQDCHANNYLKMPVRGAPPEDGSAWEWSSCSTRGLRGGSYIDFPAGLRAAVRDSSDPGVRQPNMGFRVAREND
jgi:formylglycine-generating enzyme required for sulfatase activity